MQLNSISRFARALLRITSWAAILLTPALSGAQNASALHRRCPRTLCRTAEYHQFDFWVGDWRVYDAKTNEVVALDRVEKLAHGCIVAARTSTMLRPTCIGVLGWTTACPASGVNRFDGESWLEMWADDQWGAIVLRGRPAPDKAMVLTTIITNPRVTGTLRLEWEKHADGSVPPTPVRRPRGQRQVGVVRRPDLSPRIVLT